MLEDFFQSVSHFRGVVYKFIDEVAIIAVLFGYLCGRSGVVLLFQFVQAFLQAFYSDGEGSLFLFAIGFLLLFGILLFSGIDFFFVWLLCLFRLFFFAQSFRVYQLYSHDIKGCKNEECLERAKILYTLTADEVSNHVSRTVEEFQKGTSKAIIYIEEASGADRGFLIHDGIMIADVTAREMLSLPELLAAAGLTPPMPVQMYYDLKQAGIVLARCPLTLEERAEELCRSQ